MNSCCLKRLYKSHVIELMLEKSEQSQNWGWPHYIVDYLVGKEMRDYTWSEDDESTTYYLSKPKLFVEGATENLGASEALHNLALKKQHCWSDEKL